MSIDLASIGRELKKPVENIETAIKLLDEGNTIPFITRFRKDQTGGLSEDQLLVIKTSVSRLRALSERKAFVSKSIDSQEKLTDQIRKQIESAKSTREIEDIYLPYKPKKQTLATIAKQNGLEPLAMDIFEGREPEKDLASRATDFVRVDKQLNSVDEVIAGVKHILAEKFSDNASLRNELRAIINQGSLSTKLVEIAEPVEENTKSSDVPSNSEEIEPDVDGEQTESTDEVENSELNSVEEPEADTASQGEINADVESKDPTDSELGANAESAAELEHKEPDATAELSTDSNGSTSDNIGAESISNEQAAESEVHDESNKTRTDEAKKESKNKKKKKKKKVDDPYKDFHDFSHPVAKMQYHKTLAINRGEKNGRIKVKVEYDEEKFLEKANNQLVPQDHPFKEFLQECVKDGMSRLVAPSLERETRREITEAAEKHAVSVFARNLKNLLLQSPVREHNVLAIDPGYKRGCSVAVLDKSGQLLENAHVFVVGNEKRRVESKEKLAELVKTNDITLIAIGNGAACREAEQMISDLLAENFADGSVKYAIVNEAGASFYSTSEVGREEFPDLSPAIRSAVSIGRRLIDPLSELVKISPANIGVGLYQHDVKAKHLAESLDDVVQFCVNRVGVDVNTASTSLLKYVSGLNQLTARRVFEFREENGPFKNREELKKVSGFGDATFIQSAGFLRVHSGDQPLDTTAVHPENYDAARKIIEKAGGNLEEIFPIASSCGKGGAEQSGADTESTESGQKEDAIRSPEVAAEDQPATEEKPVLDNENGTDDSPIPEVKLDQPDASNEEKDVEQVVESENLQENPVKNPSTSSTAKPTVTKVLQLSPEQIKRRKELVRTIRDLDVSELAKELATGQLLMQDIVHCVCRPEYDPRNNINRPIFRSGIIKIDDLSKDMQLDAQVVNVVDFGVFVDIGLGTSCLVHVSQLANHFIRDPHRFYAVGDSLRVWVTEVATEQRRVKLTAVQPKSLRPQKKTDRKSTRSFGKTNFRKGKQTGKPQFKQKRKAKPKQVKPITDEMLAGAEPMRSFSDLAQFFDKQSDDKNQDGKSK